MFIFFFKQKTAYEMRISDWSSDVCSSDLRQIVRFSEVLSTPEYDNHKSPVTLALGHDIGGKPVITDLAKMPHLLVAGTTGSGKSEIGRASCRERVCQYV